MKTFITALFLFTLSLAAIAQRGAEGIKAKNLVGADLGLMNQHDPASALASFSLMDDYQVNLFAAEPMLANPVHMIWDSKGRLWVACSWAYPQLKPGEEANDKIIILEDTDDDGQADQSTVFADGLYLPTGLELANGGCYVGQSPDVFFFKDTDGDDVADVKEVVLTGFGIEDSHHSISAWRRGPGGWIYFQEGIFLHTQVETPYGVVRNFNGGVYQFNPRTQELRLFVRGTGGNPWGHVFDRWGQSFMVNNPRILYLSPHSGASNQASRIPPLISTEKQCGGDLATGVHVADDLRGQLLTCRFKSRTIIRYELIENGAGYRANVLPPLLASKHPNFRPVDCKIGPDGALYVADWYSSIINHAQHDFRDPRRDNEHGRVWRITHKDRPLIRKPRLAGAALDTLLDHLMSPNAWTRHQARKELSERPPESVLRSTESWVEKRDPAEPGYSGHLVEAMWACQNVETPSEAILTKVLHAKDGRARAAGARMIRYWHQSLTDPVAMIAQLVADPFPRTRMEAVLSAGFIPRAEAFTAALGALDHEQDEFLTAALPQTMRALEAYWRPALRRDALRFAKPAHQDYAERVGRVGFEKHLTDFLKQRNPSPAELAEIRSRFASSANATIVRTAFRALGGKQSTLPNASKLVLLDGLEQRGKQGNPSEGKRIPSLSPLLEDPDDAIAAAAATNIGVWKMTRSGRDLLKVLRNEGRSALVRTAAAEAMGRLQQTQPIEALTALTEHGDLRSRSIATIGLTHADLTRAAEAAAAILSQDPGEMEPSNLVASFIRRDKGATQLSAQLDREAIHPRVLEQVAAYHRRTGQLPRNLARLFSPASPESLTQQLLAERRAQLVADVIERGDPANGEMIFRRQGSACAACHGIGSVGPAIGPNLVAVGAAASPDYLVESILSPNKAIAEQYENVMLTLIDGSVQTGVITHQSKQEIVLSDATVAGREIRISTDQVRRRRTTASLMPEGLADQLNSRQEFLDLANFLSQLGRPGPYENNERPLIRKWRLSSGESGKLPNGVWIPAYSTVTGELPAADLAAGDITYARGYVNILVGGSIKLDLNGAKGLRLWVDDTEVEAIEEAIPLTKGRKTLTFEINRPLRGTAGLRVLLTPADPSVRFQPEGGI